MKYLVHLADKDALNSSIVGQKFSSLSRANRAGFAVPTAVAISAEAHRFFIAHKRWPEGLTAEVLAIADDLGLAGGLAVRSSAISEDLENQSFAGQYSTFLNVANGKDLKVRIEQCWRSAEKETVKSYLRVGALGSGEEEIPLMGVILQKMVDAIFAGVAFSRNPMNPARNEIVIEGVRGLAENLVSGHTSPCRVLVDRRAGVRESVRLDDSHRFQGKHVTLLEDIQWKTIADLVRQLEADIYHKPLDIEWAIDEANKLWLLQSRYITTVEDDEPVAPTGIWTRKIADDLWADRLTPFLADAMITNAPRYDLSRILKIIGIQVIAPTLTVIKGYLYVNCESLKQVLAFIPHRFRIADLQALFPPAFKIDDIQPPGIFKIVSLVARGIFLLLIEPGANPIFCLWLSYYRQKKIKISLAEVARLSDDTPEQSLKKALTALDTMAVIQEKNQWPYFYATVFTWVLRWFVVDRLGFSHSDFLCVLSASGKNITVEIERNIKKLAQKIDRDKDLRERFLNESADMLAVDLPEKFQNDFDIFLEKFGCRSRHRTLYVQRWTEAPEEVIAILKSLVQHRSTSTERDPKDHFSPPPQSRLKIRKGGKSWISRLGLWFILKLVLRFLDLRENLRFLLDQALFQIRLSLLALGRQTGLAENVLFLNAEELNQLVVKNFTLDEVISIASQRHKIFSEPLAVSRFYIDGRPVREFPTDAGVIKGTGTSPGRVTGRARIVADPVKVDLKEGDILVAKNTDPGWTPILSIVSGIVAEEGGLLNHCSIVARELGIPSIVGVRQATQKIPEGSLITIDGGLGLIRIENQKTAGDI
jgi:pyruvate,water dikinase